MHQVLAFQCDHCRHTHAQASRMAQHEAKRCSSNPEVHACKTCALRVRLDVPPGSANAHACLIGREGPRLHCNRWQMAGEGGAE
jgi:transcription elongation factor Elf1